MKRPKLYVKGERPMDQLYLESLYSPIFRLYAMNMMLLSAKLARGLINHHRMPLVKAFCDC